MKVGRDLRTGFNRRRTAWKSWDDLSLGDFTEELLLHDYPEIVLWLGQTIYLSGPWNGVRFSGVTYTTSNPLYKRKFVQNKDEVYTVRNVINESRISRVIVNQHFILNNGHDMK